MPLTKPYSKSRCNLCLASLLGMLQRERNSYDSRPNRAISDSSSDYSDLRRSLIDVFDEVFSLCQLQHRDTVSVAVFYLDRFISSQQQHRFVNVQVAAMACFYLAVKLYEPTVIPPAMICELFQRTLDCGDDEDNVEDDDDASTGTSATAESIESMELRILLTLKWNLNPPTSMMFVRYLLSCLPDVDLIQWKQLAMKLAQTHLDCGLKSMELSSVNASTKAVAALFSAVEALPAIQRVPVYKFILKAVYMTDAESQREVLKVQGILKQLVMAETTSCSTNTDTVEVASAAASTPTNNRKHTLPSFVEDEEEQEEERAIKKQKMFVDNSLFATLSTSPRSIFMARGGLMMAQ